MGLIKSPENPLRGLAIYIPMAIIQVVSPRAGKYLSITLIFLTSVSFTPALVGQTPKELVTDACNNLRRQLQQKVLAASRIERRASGHLYMEDEIETVDGPIRRLISVDGRDLTALERKQDDDRLRDLAQNPKAQQAVRKDHDADAKKLENLLRVIPDAFLFEDDGKEGGAEKIALRPNPDFIPKTYEERAIHAMSGYMTVDLQDKWMVKLSATLQRQVDFGFGVLGHLDKGGSISLTRTRLSPGVWKTSSSKTGITGKMILLKTINKQQDETRSDLRLVAPETSITQAVQQLIGQSPVPLY